MRGPSRHPNPGWMVEGTGVLLIAAGLLAPVTLAALVDVAGPGAAISGILLCFPAIVAGLWLRRAGRRMRAPSGVSILRGEDPAFALFLRSFDDEELLDPTTRFGRLRTPRYEESICNALAFAGDVLAVGRPNERLPELGAARLYVADHDWQRVVATLMRQARVVFVVAGASEGIQWEIMTALKLDPRPPLIVFFPFLRSETEDPSGRSLLLDVLLVNSPVAFTKKRREKMRAARDARYRSFRQLLEDKTSRMLPESLGSDSLLFFPSAGEPRPILTIGSPWWHNVLLLRRGGLDIDFKRTLKGLGGRATTMISTKPSDPETR